jgi:hypothetical protein
MKLTWGIVEVGGVAYWVAKSKTACPVCNEHWWLRAALIEDELINMLGPAIIDCKHKMLPNSVFIDVCLGCQTAIS